MPRLEIYESIIDSYFSLPKPRIIKPVYADALEIEHLCQYDKKYLQITLQKYCGIFLGNSAHGRENSANTVKANYMVDLRDIALLTVRHHINRLYELGNDRIVMNYQRHYKESEKLVDILNFITSS